MTSCVYIDGVKAPGASQRVIREAVAAGKLVVLKDNAGISVQVDKATLARIDRRSKYFPSCTTSPQKPKTPSS